MSTRVVFEITVRSPPRTARSRAFARHPALRQESVAWALLRPAIAVAQHRIEGPPDAIAEVLEAIEAELPRATRLTVHFRGATEVVFTTVGPPYPKRSPGWQRRVDAVAWRLLGQHRYFVEKLEGFGRTGRWTLVTENDSALPRFLRRIAANCAQDDREFRLRSIRPYTPPGAEPPAVSAKQAAALTAAWRAGYYDGRARVQDVAREVGLSPSGLHGLLARAERTVMRDAVARLASAATARPTRGAPKRGEGGTPPTPPSGRATATARGARRPTRRQR